MSYSKQKAIALCSECSEDVMTEWMQKNKAVWPRNEVPPGGSTSECGVAPLAS